jgi:hypothetical protein
MAYLYALVDEYKPKAWKNYYTAWPWLLSEGSSVLLRWCGHLFIPIALGLGYYLQLNRVWRPYLVSVTT